MKMYSELQITQALKHYNVLDSEILKIISFLEPIDIPSDEYIDEVFQPMTELNAFYKDGFINGAKWMREQIIGLETNNIEEPKQINMIPKIIKENGKVKIEGNFEFSKGDKLILDLNDGTLFMNITFKHSPELPADVLQEDAIELLAEKLKQDFIKFNQNK